MKRPPIALVGLAVAGLTLLTGCGGGSPSASTTPTQTPTTGPTSAPSTGGAFHLGHPVTKVATTGHRIDLGAVDGFRHLYVMVDSVNRHSTCSAGTKATGTYVGLTMTVTGVKGKGKAQSPVLVEDWKATDKAGKSVDADYSKTLTCMTENEMFPATLPQSDVAHGTLLFDVPTTTRSLSTLFTYAHPKPVKMVIELP
jgi:hypothetical protein